MNPEKIRADFSIFSEHRGLIYMDSASTSLTPEPVLDATLEYYRSYNANVGRGVHHLSQIASAKYENAHSTVANFINAGSGVIVFTKNTTEGINTVASGIKWQKGDKIITSILEHHSNLLPWLRLREIGVEVEIINPESNGILDPADFEAAITDRTRLVALTHASNAIGTIQPIEKIVRICKDRGVLVLVDGAQSVPHLKVDVEASGLDFLCFSGHKMLGPTGTGVLWMREPVIEPLFLGGGMIEEVTLDHYEFAGGYERFEGGTPNIGGAIGLSRACEYLEEVGMDELRSHEEQLTGQLIEGLREIERVEVYGDPDPEKRVGTVSFNIDGLNPHDVAHILDESSNIMVRSGHHCASPLMAYMHIDGSVRASLYLYNTEDEVETLLATVERITKVM
ncbi:MAG: cysteine desulfurase [Candidatus Syntrophoarchaeum caldarius]|uniref:cysteine desulfurase n=1 Tax=Candidatus Syntropharchaeum caldarium TaxID=1838285 RepID=A0A1F2PBH4_9EURY|nr:MAG: cysteine desulfurase [Candidatus Syntrophoarchaeum caldarius]